MLRLKLLLTCVLLGAIAITACNRETTPAVETGPTTTGVVTGTLTALAAEAAITDPIPTPFTISATERGVGGAQIDGATANGKSVQINWDAGQPLPVSGAGGGLALNAAAVHITEKAITWSLDGGARDFLPGTYRLGSSVAIGERGLGRPADSATFTAGSDTAMTAEGAVLVLQPRALRIEGREGSLALVGNLTLGTETGDRAVKKITFGPGIYEVTLTPVAGGYKVQARLEGRVVA